jgi:hypothetical protein
MATATMTTRLPLPPFTRESAIQKIRLDTIPQKVLEANISFIEEGSTGSIVTQEYYSYCSRADVGT